MMPAEVLQVLRLKESLKSFSESTGLDINYNKSSMIPINLDEATIAEMATALGCQVGKLQLLNSVISSMPIYFLCTLHIPAGIIKQLERI